MIEYRFQMIALGITLLLTGAALVVAELHVVSGVLTVTAGISLIAGWAILIGALGGGAVIAVPVGIALGTVGAVRGLKVTRNAAPLHRRPCRRRGALRPGGRCPQLARLLRAGVRGGSAVARTR
jgi:hypothetical protein